MEKYHFLLVEYVTIKVCGNALCFCDKPLSLKTAVCVKLMSNLQKFPNSCQAIDDYILNINWSTFAASNLPSIGLQYSFLAVREIISMVKFEINCVFSNKYYTLRYHFKTVNRKTSCTLFPRNHKRLET